MEVRIQLLEADVKIRSAILKPRICCSQSNLRLWCNGDFRLQ